MPGNFPSPLAILGVPSPKELFNEFVNVKKRIETLEQKIETQEKKIDNQRKKIERLETKTTNLKRQLANIKKNTKKKPSRKRKASTNSSILPTNLLARKIIEKKKGRITS